MTTPGRRLSAPLRRVRQPPLRRLAARAVERTGLAAWRAGSWLVGNAPERVSVAVVRAGLRASYWAWPTKRRWANLNFSHVLGRPPDDPAVRRLALAAYDNYARYLVELQRLPNQSAAEVSARVEAVGLEEVAAIWRASGRGLILTSGHFGNLEAAAAGLAHHGWPVSGVADDSSFPELFALLAEQRARWGVTIIPWRRIRDIFDVLRRKEILALVVDWGYRPDGIPVRLFGAWTTLPAGPAVLAAKSRSPILPMVVRRLPGGRFFVSHDEPIEVPDSGPATLRRATQAVADALERAIAAAPEQWYSFKPVWPEDPAAGPELERRAAEMDVSSGTTAKGRAAGADGRADAGDGSKTAVAAGPRPTPRTPLRSTKAEEAP